MLPQNTVKVFHAGSLVSGIGAILTDLTFFGGSGTLFATALAGNEVFKKADPSVQAATVRFGEALDREFQASGLTPGRQGIVLKMLKHYWPTALEIAEGKQAASEVLRSMRRRIEDSPYDDEVNGRAVSDFERIVAPALEAALEPQTDDEAFQHLSL